MKMITCRRIAAVLAGLTIVCGGTCKIWILLPQFIVNVLSFSAILFGILAILVVIRFHNCPNCHKFVPVVFQPETCVHCGENLNEIKE